LLYPLVGLVLIIFVVVFVVAFLVSASLGIGFIIHYLIPAISLDSGVITGAICLGITIFSIRKRTELPNVYKDIYDDEL